MSNPSTIGPRRHLSLLRPARLLMASVLTAVACSPIPGQSGDQSPKVGPGEGLVPLQLSSPLKPALQNGGNNEFQTQAYDTADVYKANVSVTGPGMASPIDATGNPVAMPNGQGAGAVSVVVPVGNNRVITAAGLDPNGSALPGWITVKGVTNVNPGVNAAVPVNWTTTPTAKVIEALVAANSTYAATVDAAQIQTLINQITVPAGSPPNVTYTVHPSLVNATTIANAIISGGGTVPGSPPPGSTITPGTITGTIGGLVLNKTANVVANDPASAPVTTNAAGAYTITGVTPGSGITVRATTFFTDDVTASTSVSPGGTGSANANLPPLHYISRSLYTNGGIVNKVMRWTRMPIQILIVRPSNPAAIGWNSDYEAAMQEAAARWTSQLGDVLSFNFSATTDNNPSLAAQKAASDMWVDWVKNFGDGRLGYAQASFSYCGGCTPNGTDLSVHIQLATSLPDASAALPNYSYRGVAEHELGHAMGSFGDGTTNGHSDQDTDLMFFSTDPYFPINLIPTARDYKTQRLLYTTPADITRLP